MGHRGMPKKKYKENESVYSGCDNRISLDQVTQEARIQKVIDLLCEGKSRTWIRDHLTEIWQVSKVTSNTLIDQALIYMSEHTGITADQVKKLNYNRLENIIGESETVSDKCRVIDLENKMYGVYETNVNINTKDTNFTFDIDLN